MITSLFILCFASTLVFGSTDEEQQLEVLSDSTSKKIGQKDFIPFYQEYMRLTGQQNDTIKINDAYSLITSHYHRLRNTDSLKVITCEYMDQCLKYGNVNNYYTQWRRYIQLLTEKGLQDETMHETELPQKDADATKGAFGMACGEMCIGYSHRVFSNNIELCFGYYSPTLKRFNGAGFYEDTYVVSLNIIQAHLARGGYADAIEYLNCMPGLIEEMKRKDTPIQPELTMCYYQFRVIATLALKGKKEAQPFIAETNKFYYENINAFPHGGWLGYKILCARMLSDNQMALNHLDSLMGYHYSVGSCCPVNHLLKAQSMEQVGRFEDACEVYKSYAHINDFTRSAELDEQLSRYTVQFEVDKLEHDKLELRTEVNCNLFTTSVIVGCLVLVLLTVITFYCMRSLSLNRELGATNRAVTKTSHMKSSLTQHTTHGIRTPLNPIIGFSSLMAAGGLTQEEMEEHARQMESGNAYLLDLVNNVIDIADMDSQTDGIPKKPVSVDACCQECLELIRQNLKGGIKLQHMPSPTPVEVCTVEIWMRCVLLGLLNNANKFTETGFIRLSHEEDKPNRPVRFIIEDSGPGIEEHFRDAIFECLTGADTFTQGTGLGLSIIHQIMELVDENAYLDTSHAGGAGFVVE